MTSPFLRFCRHSGRPWVVPVQGEKYELTNVSDYFFNEAMAQAKGEMSHDSV